METRRLGRTGLTVSRLGVGLAEIGGLDLAEAKQAGEVLNLALDNGITFFDTAACYSNSEALIGQTIAHRRDEFILATKAGHVAGGYEGESWTAQTIRDSIDRSLKRMRTDHLDIVQLHTCSVDVLERGEVIEALQAAQGAGKTRFIGYSGDNDGALWAVESGLFDTLQTSFNLVDQNARLHLFGPAQEQEMGIIVKRPIANGAWGATAAPSSYAAQYFQRAQEMAALGPLPKAPDHRILLALGFVFAHDPVDTFIVGTRNPDHMRANIELVNSRLPIAGETADELRSRFDQLGVEQDWRQLS
ncbi:MAG: aldo/keto reductase [Anaerolineae bacterium]|nr:aldo/keto reductase [Anaerolineae bacterium]